MGLINSIEEIVVYDTCPEIDNQWARPDVCYQCPVKKSMSL